MTTLVENRELRALVVDDDAIVRRMVSYALAQEGFSSDAASDGDEALSLMRETQYDLLVTDLRMPNKHGHSLAVEVLDRKPRPKIMVHTSVDDPRMTKDLIIRGVEDVIYKPTNYAAFAAKAKGLILRDRKERDRKNGIAWIDKKSSPDDSEAHDETNADGNAPVGLSEMITRLADLSKIRPVSHAALDVSNMVRSKSFNAEQVASAVQRDPVLAAKIIQLANNPFYNSTGSQITDIKQAVTRIGQKRVGEFTLAMSAFASVTPESLPWMDLDLAWRRSVAAGIAVELLIKQGEHASISEGLLFSTLMHSSGRTVLGTRYPDRYEVMVSKCIENGEPLSKHEQSIFPENPAEVMCRMLADWSIPSEVYQPLKHILSDYANVATLPDPVRTRVELIKLAILLGHIAVGRWEPWDLVEFPPKEVIDRLRIVDLGAIIEQTKIQLPGVADLRTDSQTDLARNSHSHPDPRALAYYSLSKEPFDFLAEIVSSMKINLQGAGLLDIGRLGLGVLVNRIGAASDQSTVRLFESAKCDKVVFVSDADTMQEIGNAETNIAMPCSYATLRGMCWAAANASSKRL